MNPGKAGIHSLHCVISVKREWVAKRREEFDCQVVLDQRNSSYHTQPYPINSIEKMKNVEFGLRQFDNSYPTTYFCALCSLLSVSCYKYIFHFTLQGQSSTLVIRQLLKIQQQ